MASTYTPIASTTLTATQSSVTFNSFSGYTDLILVCSYLRSSTSQPLLRFNSDSATNYSYTTLSGNGTSAASSRASSVSSINLSDPFNGNTSNFLPAIIQINNYANSTTYKTVLVRNNDASFGLSAKVGLWRNTAAITSLTITAATGLYGIGSTFSLYGVLNA